MLLDSLCLLESYFIISLEFIAADADKNVGSVGQFWLFKPIILIFQNMSSFLE